MSETNHTLFREPGSAGWVRLRTLIVIRWFAVAGQISAITVAQVVFDLQLELDRKSTRLNSSH